MDNIFSEVAYNEMIEKLFLRFPSFQKVGAGAYKPGIANMEFADQLMGHPHRKYKIIHVAGTNGKGSVSNMLTSVLAASGLKVGLYTSPHNLDFRERMRIVSPPGECRLVSKENVWEFVNQWQETFDHLDMSFFEITTMMALNWFAAEGVDVVVLETGLGGRLDSTNIVTPVLSVITNIGLDHCDMLGETLPEIAFEKAGIIKPKVPVVVGESHPEIDSVFERKVLYTNLPEIEFMGSRTAVMELLTFADKTYPSLWDDHKELLSEMDLQGEYQQKNLRTVLAALDILKKLGLATAADADMKAAIVHTAARTDFHGRWEKLSDSPYTICDIGHNEHGLKYNFAQLRKMMESGQFSKLILVYGSVADKDVDAALRHLPEQAVCIFTQANSKRALAAEKIKEKYLSYCTEASRDAGDIHVTSSVSDALALSAQLAV
ncbi:MAG: hypothetical protein J6Q12_09435, partial [Bacteroidales bacterium]|nr:hypothetical protein [Bacteroidales bacterium]